jgi:hypothetical protein
MAKRNDREFQTQTVMIIAEVVETADELHGSHQRLGAARQSPSSPHQIVQPLTESGIEPFDKSSIKQNNLRSHTPNASIVHATR